MTNKDLFNQKEFPEWEGYNTTDEKIVFIKELWLNDINLLTKSFHETTLRAGYYQEMLLYIQRKLYLGEPLNLCLNSTNEVFDIMITPCEILNEKGMELTLDDYDDISEYTVEKDFHDLQVKDYMQCKTCNYGTYNIIDKSEFNNHDCDSWRD